MNKRKAAHKDIDDQVALILQNLNRANYQTENDYILAVNMCDKVYRPFLHCITDAELDGIDPAAVTIAMVELAVSMTQQMASLIVPEGQWQFARRWFGTVNQQIMEGNANSCAAMFPQQSNLILPETLQ